MEENNKVIVFEKKEIALMLIFVVVMIITGFTIGIRLGKKIALNEAGIKPQDQKTVELKSGLEEDAEKIVKEGASSTDEEKLKKLMEESKERLSNELEKFSSEEAPAKAEASKAEEKPKLTENTTEEKTEATAAKGKYTVQLGSYPNLEEAKQFAEGFTVRGYNPIIYDTKIQGKGTWYRVSLGMFATVEEAKSYIKKEQTLFSGQDYVITELK